MDENPVVTLGDLLEDDEISLFESSRSVLHFKESNIIKIKGKYYECRIFAFDVSDSSNGSISFKDYVESNQLHQVELSRKVTEEPCRIQLLSYYKSTPEEYILISLRPLNLESKKIVNSGF